MSSKNIKIAAIATVVSVLAACGPTDLTEITPDSDLPTELAAQPSYEISATDSLRAQAAALRIDRTEDIDFEIQGGEVVLATTNTSLELVDLRFDLADVTVPADILPPSGLELTSISVELAAVASADAAWTSDASLVTADLSVDLLLHWSTIRDDREISLGDIMVDAVPVRLTVTREDGRTVASLSANRSGAFWSWAGTFELRDLELRLSAR